MTGVERQLMGRALELARNSLYLSDPNPRVGCVIVRDGSIVAEGWTQAAGSAHAEIHALERLGGEARGADVYVTLEPCSHTGRTGPCADALIAAGVRRVFAAMVDPNPLVAGEGVERLRQAGIEVHVGLGEEEAATLNPGFLRRMRGGLPWVRVKLGASVDGRTADARGASRWITSEAARADVQRWRARSSAVVTGIGTVLADDPALNVRIEGAAFQPLRVVLDSRGRMPRQARIFTMPGEVLVVTAAQKADAMDNCMVLAGPQKVDLLAVLRVLAERRCNEVLVEAGPTLCGAFARSGLVDEYVIYLAPRLLGARGLGMFDLGEDATLADALALEFVEVTHIGPDLRVIARPAAAH